MEVIFWEEIFLETIVLEIALKVIVFSVEISYVEEESAYDAVAMIASMGVDLHPIRHGLLVVTIFVEVVFFSWAKQNVCQQLVRQSVLHP